MCWEIRMVAVQQGYSQGYRLCRNVEGSWKNASKLVKLTHCLMCMNVLGGELHSSQVWG